jgi:small-conductance mechanosensitive channel
MAGASHLSLMHQFPTDLSADDIAWGDKGLPGGKRHALEQRWTHLNQQHNELMLNRCYAAADARSRFEPAGCAQHSHTCSARRESHIRFHLSASMSLSLARGITTLLLGWLLARLLLKLIRSFLAKHFDRQQQLMTEQLIFWLLMILFVVNALNQAGSELSVLLGAAGILLVAVGCAAQISAANIISGLFVVGERSISFDDIVKVGENTGEVVPIDWLSINFRTFYRLLVRIPNESFIKSLATNLSKFPVRRLDMQLRSAYSEAIGYTRSVLLQAAAANPQSLASPKLLIIKQGFGESSINRQFSVWAQRENFFNMRNGLREDAKNTFDAAGIELLFSHQTLLFRDQTLLFCNQTPLLPIHITTPSSSNMSQST